MTGIRARLRNGLIVFGLLALLGACGQEKDGSNQDLETGDGTGTSDGTGEGTEGGTGVGADMITGTSTATTTGEPADDQSSLGGGSLGTDLGNAAQQSSGTNQQDLLSQIQTSFDPLGPASQGILGLLLNGGSQSQAQSAQQAYLNAFLGFGPLAALLERLGFTRLARNLERMALLRPVYGYRVTSKYRHYYTLSLAEFVVKLAGNSTTKYDSIAFWVYERPFEDCTRLLVRCSVPSADAEYVASVSCGKNRKVSDYGYVCASAKADPKEAPLALERFRFPGARTTTYRAGDYVVNRSAARRKSLIKNKWKSQGILGYPPQAN